MSYSRVLRLAVQNCSPGNLLFRLCDEEPVQGYVRAATGQRSTGAGGVDATLGGNGWSHSTLAAVHCPTQSIRRVRPVTERHSSLSGSPL